MLVQRIRSLSDAVVLGVPAIATVLLLGSLSTVHAGDVGAGESIFNAN